MTRASWLPASFVLISFAVSLIAAVPLDPRAGAGFTVGLPRAWVVVEDAKNGLLVARASAGNEDVATALFLFKQGANSQSEEQILDSMSGQFAKRLRVQFREALPGGGHQMLADGMAGNVPVRLGMIAVVVQGTTVVSLLTAKPAEFDALGGMEVVTGMMASLQVGRAGTARPGSAPAPSGKLDVPPLTRVLTQAELAGEWANDDSVMTNYVNYRGDYAGYQSISIRDKWMFDGKGGVIDTFNAVTAGRGGARQVNERKSGTATVAPNLILTLGWTGAPAPSYVIRGWLEMKGMTVLLLNGPWWGQVPADVMADRTRGTNLNSYWVRKSP